MASSFSESLRNFSGIQIIVFKAEGGMLLVRSLYLPAPDLPDLTSPPPHPSDLLPRPSAISLSHHNLEVEPQETADPLTL